MKKIAIKLLIKGLAIFEAVIVSKINSEQIKRLIRLLSERLKLFGEALIDVDPNNNAQVEKIAKETLMSPAFMELESGLTAELAAKIPNPVIRDLITSTDALRLKLFSALVDENTSNSAQVNALLNEYVKSESFDTNVLNMVQLLLDKYAKNELVKSILFELIEDLVNSDDQTPV